MRSRSLVFVTAAVLLIYACLPPPSEAKVVYTPADKVLTGSGDFLIDFNADGISDVDIHENVIMCDAGVWAYPNTNDGVIYGTVVNNEEWASALNTGYVIGASSRFGSSGAVLADYTPTPGCPFPHGAGYWLNAGTHYLGVQFTRSGKTRFGWVELSVSSAGFRKVLTTTLMGYAYQTIVGKPIRAGQT